MKPAVKRIIITMALWGIIPPTFASWLIQRLRLGAV
jgi:hypothetical protein